MELSVVQPLRHLTAPFVVHHSWASHSWGISHLAYDSWDGSTVDVTSIGAQRQTVARRRCPLDESIADGERGLHEVLKILETIFQPAHLRQGQSHVDADLENAIAECNLGVVFV